MRLPRRVNRSNSEADLDYDWIDGIGETEKQGVAVDLVRPGWELFPGDGDSGWFQARLDAEDAVCVGLARNGEGELVWSRMEATDLTGCADDARGGCARAVEVDEQFARSGCERDAGEHGKVFVEEINKASMERDRLGVGKRLVETRDDNIGTAAEDKCAGLTPRKMYGCCGLAGEFAECVTAVGLISERGGGNPCRDDNAAADVEESGCVGGNIELRE